MSAVQTAIKPVQKTNVASKTFTGTKSKQYMKQMTGVNVSTIAYMRGFFPDQAFEEKAMKSDLNVKLLRKNVHPGADRLIAWLVGVQHAIEAEFLESVTLAIVNDLQKPTEVSESYTFIYDYSNGGYNMSFNSSMATSTSAGGGEEQKDVPTKAQVEVSTTKMLRHLVKLTALQKELSNNVFLTMRLTYNENRPCDYLPPGFMHETEEFELADITESIKFRVGGFHTGTGGMHLQVKLNKNTLNTGIKDKTRPITPSQAFGKSSSLRDRSLNSTGNEMDQSVMEEQSHDQSAMEEGSRDTTVDEARQLPPIAGLSQEEVTNEEEEEVEQSSQEEEETTMEQDSYVMPQRIKKKPSPIAKAVDEPDMTSQTSATSSFGTANDEMMTQESSVSKVRCPCLDEVEEGLMLTCDICGYQQHAICFCLPNDSTPPQQHVCSNCCNSTRPCTDPRLAGMKSNQIQFLCIWRRTLQAYQGTSCQITTNELMTKFNCTKYCAAKVIAKMQKDGLVETYKNKKMVQRQLITETFTREIRHVAQNLKRQRGEICTGSQTNTSKRSLSWLKDSITNTSTSSADNNAGDVFSSKPKMRKINNNNSASAYNFDTTDEMELTITNEQRMNTSFSKPSAASGKIWNNKTLKMGSSGVMGVKRKPLATKQHQEEDVADISSQSSVSEFKTNSIWKKATVKKGGKKRSLEPYNAMLASQSSVFDYEAQKNEEDHIRGKMRR